METLVNRDLFTYKLSSSKEIQYAIAVLVRRLTEWRRFHFSYQPRDAVNSGSSLNCFAFKRSINPPSSHSCAKRREKVTK